METRAQKPGLCLFILLPFLILPFILHSSFLLILHF